MLSVMIECGEGAGALGATLASLVPGAIEGLVREVVVLDRGMDAAAKKVADHAGCRFVPQAGLVEAIVGAKGEWLLLLEPGARLGAEWVETVSGHLADVMAGAAPKPARFSIASRDAPPLLRRLFRHRTALNAGLILMRSEALAHARQARSLEGLAKGLPALRLESAIRPRPSR